MRAVPLLEEGAPFRISAGYKASLQDNMYTISRMPTTQHSEIVIMRMPTDLPKVERALQWFIDNDSRFNLILLLTPPDSPPDLTSLLMSCIQSLLASPTFSEKLV